MSGTAFGDYFTDPTMMGLLGAAQGFGQAAMPSRMPIPFGAALGLAAGGLSEGARAANKLALEREQTKAAQLNNRLLGASLPFREQLLGTLGGASAGGTGALGGALAGGGATGAPSTVGALASGAQAQPSLSGNYLVSPEQRKQLALYAIASNQDRAAASLFGGIDSMAGGPGYAMGTGGASTYVPGGPHDPSVLSRNTYATKIPEANVKVWEDWQKPGEQPGGGYGTPQQTLGVPPQIGAGGTVAPTDPFPQIAARITGSENATGDPAARNPRSSATGDGQFINDTWLRMVQSVRPDIAQLPKDKLLALRADPQLSQFMTENYARQNGASLAQSGLPVTPDALYLAHRFGPQGASTIMRAQPTAPLAMLFPKTVLDANPDLQGKTAGDMAATAQRVMAQPGREIAPGITQRTSPTGSVVTTNTFPVQQKLFDRDMADLDKATASATHIQQNMTRLYDMRDMAKQLTESGFGGETRAAISNFVDTYIKPLPGMSGAGTDFIRNALKLPDAALAQEFAKLNLQAAGAQERENVGARGGFRLTEMYQKANPSIGLQPTANIDIANLQLVAHQMDLDYLRGLHDHVTSNGQQFALGKSDYVPAAEYDKQWVKQDNPKVYLAATYALNGKPFDQWAKMLGTDKDKIGAAINVVRRVDPNAQIMWQDGKPHVFAPEAPG